MYAAPSAQQYYYGYTQPWYGYAGNQYAEGPKIVELEPSEIGGARSQIDGRSDLVGNRRFDAISAHTLKGADGTIGNRYSTVINAPMADNDPRIISRRLGTRNYIVDEATMSNRPGNRAAKGRSWKEVNDDVSARMIAASSDSPPVIPKRDYDHSPAPSLPRPNRSVSSAGGRRFEHEENGRHANGPELEWSNGEANFGNRPLPYLDNGPPGYAPPQEQGGQMVLYAGGPPPPMMLFPGQQDPSMFPGPGPMALSPFGGPPLLPPPPPDLYGYGGMPFGPPPPMFMEPPPFPPPQPMMMEEGIYGAPPPMAFVPPGPPPMCPFMPPPHPMDFEMFMWHEQKSKKGKKAPKRSRSMEFFMPPPVPPPWLMPPPAMGPPPFMDENAYGSLPPMAAPPPPPPRPPLPLALPPPPLPQAPPMTNFQAPPPETKKPLNGNKRRADALEKKGNKEKKSKENLIKKSTCYLLCCRGFTQILWIIIGIILIGLVLGLVLGLTLV